MVLFQREAYFFRRPYIFQARFLRFFPDRNQRRPGGLPFYLARLAGGFEIYQAVGSRTIAYFMAGLSWVSRMGDGEWRLRLVEPPPAGLTF
jgi:hypothetical protein